MASRDARDELSARRSHAVEIPALMTEGSALATGRGVPGARDTVVVAENIFTPRRQMSDEEFLAAFARRQSFKNERYLHSLESELSSIKIDSSKMMVSNVAFESGDSVGKPRGGHIQGEGSGSSRYSTGSSSSNDSFESALSVSSNGTLSLNNNNSAPYLDFAKQENYKYETPHSESSIRSRFTGGGDPISNRGGAQKYRKSYENSDDLHFTPDSRIVDGGSPITNISSSLGFQAAVLMDHLETNMFQFKQHVQQTQWERKGKSNRGGESQSQIHMHSDHPLFEKMLNEGTGKRDILSALPVEVLLMILRQLPSSDLLHNFEYLNQRFNNILNNNQFWEDMFSTRFGDINIKNRLLQKRDHYKVLLGEQEETISPPPEEVSHEQTTIEDEEEEDEEVEFSSEESLIVGTSSTLDIVSDSTTNQRTRTTKTGRPSEKEHTWAVSSTYSSSSSDTTSRGKTVKQLSMFEFGQSLQDTSTIKARNEFKRIESPQPFISPSDWKLKYKSFFKTQENWMNSNYQLTKVTSHPCYITGNSLVTILGEVFDLSSSSNPSQLADVGTITCAIEVENSLVTGGKDGMVRMMSKGLIIDVNSEIICMQHLQGTIYIGCENGYVVVIDSFTGTILQRVNTHPVDEDGEPIVRETSQAIDGSNEGNESNEEELTYPVLCLAIDKTNLFVGNQMELQIWNLDVRRRFNSVNWTGNVNNNFNGRPTFNQSNFEQESLHQQGPPLSRTSQFSTSYQSVFSSDFQGNHGRRHGIPGTRGEPTRTENKDSQSSLAYYYHVVERAVHEAATLDDAESTEQHSVVNLDRSKDPISLFVGSSSYCVQISYNKVMIGCEDGKIRIYDRKLKLLQRKLDGHRMPVVCLQFDKQKVVSGGADSEIKVWDISSGSCIYTLRHHTEPVWHLRFDDSKLFTSSFDRSLVILDFENKQKDPTLGTGKGKRNVRERSDSSSSSSSLTSDEE